jgi:hypothetical protein
MKSLKLRSLKISIIIAILLFASAGYSATLVSDQTPVSDAVTNFKLFFNGSATGIDSAPVNRAISYTVTLPNGNHTVVAQACNIEGCSVNSVPLAFVLPVPVVPGPPVRLRLGP